MAEFVATPVPPCTATERRQLIHERDRRVTMKRWLGGKDMPAPSARKRNRNLKRLARRRKANGR